jgi:hypothetical protein
MVNMTLGTIPKAEQTEQGSSIGETIHILLGKTVTTVEGAQS